MQQTSSLIFLSTNQFDLIHKISRICLNYALNLHIKYELFFNSALNLYVFSGEIFLYATNLYPECIKPLCYNQFIHKIIFLIVAKIYFQLFFCECLPF